MCYVTGAEAVYGVKRVYTHEDYSTDADDDDIALIELDRDVQYTGYISPVCIADSSVQDDVPCIAVGWGSTLGTSFIDSIRFVFDNVAKFR